MCKACFELWRYHSKPEVRQQVKERSRKRFEERPEEYRAQAREWGMRNKDRKHSVNILNKYGLTPNQYASLLAFQRHRCALCSTHQDKLPQRLCVDHCHSSGVVRGLLCRSCNIGVGMAEKHNTGAFTYYTNYPPTTEMREREANPHGPHPA